MGYEREMYEKEFEQFNNLYDVKDMMKDQIKKAPRVIDCGELIEVNGVYVPAK